jgi:ATP-dependent RNA helicase RhlB
MRPDHLSDVEFATLPLHPLLQAGLAKLGFTHCTPIQAQTLPLALEGRDIAGQAQTGTGKSAAFLLAAMHRLLTVPRAPGADPKQPRAFMLAPTRELAIQIFKDAQGLGSETGLRMTVCYGGAGYEQQRQSIEGGVDLLVGTPGRLIDYFKQNTYNLKQIEVLVLDEADRMFDLGFIADIRYLIRKMPPPAERRNYLFSATLSHRVLELAFEHMNSPARIEIEPEKVTAEKVTQSLIHVANDDKLALLVGLLRHHDPFRTLVFVNTKVGAEMVERALNKNGFTAATLSGDVAQTRRLKLLDDFKEGRLPVLVATDVAARGLHNEDPGGQRPRPDRAGLPAARAPAASPSSWWAAAAARARRRRWGRPTRRRRAPALGR